MDRRQRKSRKALHEGLISLLQRVPFDDITIQMITDEADVARVTFYRHYASVHELVEEVLEDYRQQLKAFEEKLVVSFDYVLDFNNLPPTYFIYSLIDQNREMVKNLFLSSEQNMIYTMLYQLGIQQIQATFENVSDYPDLPTEFLAKQLVTHHLGCMFRWVREGFPHDVEYVARLTHYEGMLGTMNLIGLGHLIIMPDPDLWQLKT